jgi:hypothetical protein
MDSKEIFGCHNDHDSWYHIVNWLGPGAMGRLSQCSSLFYVICRKQLKKSRKMDKYLFHRCFADVKDIVDNGGNRTQLEEYGEKLAQKTGMKMRVQCYRMVYRPDHILINFAPTGTRLVVAMVDKPILAKAYYSSCGINFMSPQKATRMCMICFNATANLRARELYLCVEPVRVSEMDPKHFDITFVILIQESLCNNINWWKDCEFAAL